MVRVTWEDAAQMDSETWVQNEGKHAYAPHFHAQVGFLLSSTRKGVVLTSTWSPSLVSARDSIPRGMVRSIEYLEPTPARKRKAR